MESQIRQANRQGILNQRSLNPIQDLALKVAMGLEKRDRLEEDWAAFRRAILANNPEMAESLFPEFFPQEEITDIEDIDLDTLGSVEFVSNVHTLTPDMVQGIMKQFE